MAFLGIHKLSAAIDIILQRLFHFITEIDYHFGTAFSDDADAIGIEINISHIQAHTLGDTDSRTQKKRHNSQIPFFGFLIVDFFLTGQLIAAMLDKTSKRAVSTVPGGWWLSHEAWACRQGRPGYFLSVRNGKDN